MVGVDTSCVYFTKEKMDRAIVEYNNKFKKKLVQAQASDLKVGQRFYMPLNAPGGNDGRWCICGNEDEDVVDASFVEYCLDNGENDYSYSMQKTRVVEVEVEATPLINTKFPKCLTYEQAMALKPGTPLVLHHEHLNSHKTVTFVGTSKDHYMGKNDVMILDTPLNNEESFQQEVFFSDYGIIPSPSFGDCFNTTNWVEIAPQPHKRIKVRARDLKVGQKFYQILDGFLSSWKDVPCICGKKLSHYRDYIGYIGADGYDFYSMPPDREVEVLSGDQEWEFDNRINGYLVGNTEFGVAIIKSHETGNFVYIARVWNGQQRKEKEFVYIGRAMTWAEEQLGGKVTF